MEKFCNAQTFANNYDNNEKIPKELCRLILFTSYSKWGRKINSRMTFSNIAVSKDINGEEYVFKYNGKTYPFSIFSNRDLQEYDKKTLLSAKRIKECLIRSLKLACSMDLVNPRIIIGNSIVGTFNLLIAFQENGIDKVIDYARNIVMNKDDYYEIFKFDELNIADRMDLYNIYYIINKFGTYEYIYEYLIFTKEIFNELSKNETFAFFAEKFNINGMNNHNYLLFGNNSDSLFFQREDSHHMKYDKIIRELNNFTEKPTRKSKHISYDKEKDKYMLKTKDLGYITFDLLSNAISNGEVKERLLSTARYGNCHYDVHMVARALDDKDKASAYIVGGKFKVNDKDYFYHSWVEIDEKNLVIDFSHNIVMNRDDYYKLFEIVPISKTSVLEMEDIVQMTNDLDFNFHPIYLNYFGSELMRDLKKNEKMLKK